jgi:hypothetical protein
VGAPGGIGLPAPRATESEIRREVREAVQSYLGALSLAQAGTLTPGEVPPPPRLYTLYQQMKTLGALWYEGGLADQPHVLMLELSAVDEAVAAHEAQRRAFDQMQKGLAAR